MYYIEQNDDELIKYEVTLDKPKLRSLADEIFTNCAEIIHYREEGVNPRFNPNDKQHIRNYRRKFLRKIEYNHAPDEDIYLFECDKYLEPDLVILIYSLLNGETSTISELKRGPKKQQKKDSKLVLQKEIKKILSLSPDEIDLKELEYLKRELEQYQEYKKLNANKKSESKYYPKVLECITLTEISRIKISALTELESFIANINSTNMAKATGKVLKKLIKD